MAAHGKTHLSYFIAIGKAIAGLVLMVVVMGAFLRGLELPGEQAAHLKQKTQHRIVKGRLFSGLFEFVGFKPYGLCPHGTMFQCNGMTDAEKKLLLHDKPQCTETDFESECSECYPRHKDDDGNPLPNCTAGQDPFVLLNNALEQSE